MKAYTVWKLNNNYIITNTFGRILYRYKNDTYIKVDICIYIKKFRLTDLIKIKELDDKELIVELL